MLSRSRISSQNIIVWVLAPHVESADSTINYYYDFSENEKEFSRAFTELNIQWKWQYVTLDNYKQVQQFTYGDKRNPPEPNSQPWQPS